LDSWIVWFASRMLNPQQRTECFAKRNETFRIALRKPLKSLIVLNQHFAESFVFKPLMVVSFRRFRKCVLPTENLDRICPPSARTRPSSARGV
jgi:hypothetical protein